MKILIVSLFLILAVLSASSQVKINPLIVGGENINIQAAPYQVALLYIDKIFCGGSLITMKHVLTAAHCIDPDIMTLVRVKAGFTTIAQSGWQCTVSNYRIHEKYTPNASTDYDIAVLLLSSPLVESNVIKPISLTKKPEVEGATAEISGWGKTSEGGTSTSDSLKRAQVRVISRKQCQASYTTERISLRMLCATGLYDGMDSCQGDSGGPLVINGELAGIVSWGYGCARSEYPGVYANVYILANWTTQVINILK